MKFFIATLLVLWSSAVASAQSISLVCSGNLTLYEPTRSEGTISDTITVDLAARTIKIMIGTVRIVEVDDAGVGFNDRMIMSLGHRGDEEFMVSGKLDRLTGRLTIFWFRSEDLGKPWGTPSVFSEMMCNVTKRLF